MAVKLIYVCDRCGRRLNPLVETSFADFKAFDHKTGLPFFWRDLCRPCVETIMEPLVQRGREWFPEAAAIVGGES